MDSFTLSKNEKKKAVDSSASPIPNGRGFGEVLFEVRREATNLCSSRGARIRDDQRGSGHHPASSK
jgi:hypothetical protein